MSKQNKQIAALLKELRIKNVNESVCTGTFWITAVGTQHKTCISPVDGQRIAEVVYASETEYEAVMKRAVDAFSYWRAVPAPQRGELVRKIGVKLREHKNELGTLVSYEMGKSLQEGLGEVQEMIDICDFAVGLSRQLYGLSMHSERPGHRMLEQWQPLGLVGIISSFNFPVAVWSWNAMIALVCGNTCVWKPSEKAPLSAIATLNILRDVLIENNIPEGVLTLINGDAQLGRMMAHDKRFALISATGSTEMGRSVAKIVADRFGKTLLELGGNNAIILSDKADLQLAIRAVVFGAVGTAGQRCTSTRRLIVHQNIYHEVIQKLQTAYAQLKIGDPLNPQNHVGPLIDQLAVKKFLHAIEKAKIAGAKLLCGGEVLQGEGYASGCYVSPAIMEAANHYAIVQEETFAPILYVMPYQTLTEAIAMQNDVKQGLSSAIFTTDVRESEYFLSAAGSDCGIANVNIGTSGAEIGGAFGGEKETGGGRESGSDAWKAYMRRQTVTINYSDNLPLAQGISFEF
jgi:aldehyde dehydrogenase (NAD+)